MGLSGGTKDPSQEATRGREESRGESIRKNYVQEHARSVEDPATFFGEHGRRLLRFTRPFNDEKIQQLDDDGIMRWFVGGELNACYNCVDRHVDAGLGDKVALIYEKDEDGVQEKWTFAMLQRRIKQIADFLRSTLGLEKGDCVTIYMGSSAEVVCCCLAAARLGVAHNVVFGGFSAASLASRAADSHSKVIISHDVVVRAGKSHNYGETVYKSLRKLAKSGEPVPAVLFMTAQKDIRKDSQKASEGESKEFQIYDYDSSGIGDPFENTSDPDVKCVSVDSEQPLFHMYTSGSTGRPKGLTHSTAGYLLYAAMTSEIALGIEQDAVVVCCADVGWITGHTYGFYGPLLLGATTVVFGSIPTYPDAFRLFRLIKSVKGTHLVVAPTAIRMLQGLLEREIQVVGPNHHASPRRLLTRSSAQTTADSIIKSPRPAHARARPRPQAQAPDRASVEEGLDAPKEGAEEVTASRPHKLGRKRSFDNSKNESTEFVQDGSKGEADSVSSVSKHFDPMAYTLSFSDGSSRSSAHGGTDMKSFVDESLQCLKVLACVGEALNYDAYVWLAMVLGHSGRVPIVNMYWQTETGGIVLAPVMGLSQEIPESVGLPFFGVRARILKSSVLFDDEGDKRNSYKLKDGESLDDLFTGNNESGPLVLQGCWPGLARTIVNDVGRFKRTYFFTVETTPAPTETSALVATPRSVSSVNATGTTQFFVTGDSAGRDEAGNFWVYGRVDDVVNVSGHRIGTAEIESSACSMDEILQAAAIGMPDAVTGQAVVLFVVISKHAKNDCQKLSNLKASVTQHLRADIGKFVSCREMVFCTEVPRTSSGKVMRRVLRCLYLESIAMKESLKPGNPSVAVPSPASGPSPLAPPSPSAPPSPVTGEALPLPASLGDISTCNNVSAVHEIWRALTFQAEEPLPMSKQ